MVALLSPVSSNSAMCMCNQQGYRRRRQQWRGDKRTPKIKESETKFEHIHFTFWSSLTMTSHHLQLGAFIKEQKKFEAWFGRISSLNKERKNGVSNSFNPKSLKQESLRSFFLSKNQRSQMKSSSGSTHYSWEHHLLLLLFLYNRWSNFKQD